MRYPFNAVATLSKGQVTKYTYDSFKRVTMAQYFPDPAHPTTEDTYQRVTYTYDTGTNGWGRLATVQWSYMSTGVIPSISRSFSYSYGYTPGGLITAKTLQVNNATLTGSFTYDSGGEGHLASVAYPITYTGNVNGAPVPLPQQVYNYSYDGMGRPAGITDNLYPANTYVQGVQYNPADQMTQITYNGNSETRLYNVMNQLTRLTNAGFDMEYVFPAQNRGKLSSRVEHVTGETISYDWDSLNRLTGAHATASTMGPAWTQTFTYDGFGNLTDKTPTVGAAPALHVAVNPANNRITTSGYGYDANGNLYSGSLLSLQYDVENRATAVWSGSSMDRYSHGPDNLRVWKLRPDGVDEVYYYDPSGQRLGTYTFFNYQSTQSATTQASQELYFAGRKVKSQGPQYGQPVVKDRLGAIGPAFYPYGEEYATTTQNLDKFATYYRDGTTALDYAKNRYYSSILGRFMTPDPSNRSMNPTDAGSFNKYAYVLGDPVNNNDPSGLGESAESFCDVYSNYWLCRSDFYNPMILFKNGFAFLLGGPGAPDNRVKDIAGVPAALNRAIKSLGAHCKEVLPTQQTLLDDAKDLKFFDARAGVSGPETVAQIAPALAAYNQDGTIESVVGDNHAVTLWAGSHGEISRFVLLGKQFFLDPVQGRNSNFSVGQGMVLVHELLHYATQLSDDALAQNYGIKRQRDESSSSAISRWLQNDCKN